MSENATCSGNIAMLPIKGFGIAVDTDAILKDDLTRIEEQLTTMGKELEQALAFAKTNATYQLCEFYSFRNPQKKKGFELAHGDLLESAADLYPEAWEFLKTDEGKALCVTEDEWQAMNHAVYYTATYKGENDEDIIKEFSFDGIGGAPFYVQDLCAGTLRLPDIRGMYAEASGFDGLSVGGVHGDMIRNIEGSAGSDGYGHAYFSPKGIKGVFSPTSTKTARAATGVTGGFVQGITFNSSLVVPTGNANKPRAFGVLPCVYLGNSK